jgi:hypothetical protein
VTHTVLSRSTLSPNLSIKIADQAADPRHYTQFDVPPPPRRRLDLDCGPAEGYASGRHQPRPELAPTGCVRILIIFSST